MNSLKELPEEFTRNGQTFTQIGYNPKTEICVYKRSYPSGGIGYEVFKRKINKRFHCVSYPGDESFGRWALYVVNHQEAMRYMENGLKHNG